jgi:hypothetical protein
VGVVGHCLALGNLEYLGLAVAAVEHSRALIVGVVGHCLALYSLECLGLVAAAAGHCLVLRSLQY